MKGCVFRADNGGVGLEGMKWDSGGLVRCRELYDEREVERLSPDASSNYDEKGSGEKGEETEGGSGKVSPGMLDDEGVPETQAGRKKKNTLLQTHKGRNNPGSTRRPKTWDLKITELVADYPSGVPMFPGFIDLDLLEREEDFEGEGLDDRGVLEEEEDWLAREQEKKKKDVEDAKKRMEKEKRKAAKKLGGLKVPAAVEVTKVKYERIIPDPEFLSIDERKERAQAKKHAAREKQKRERQRSASRNPPPSEHEMCDFPSLCPSIRQLLSFSLPQWVKVVPSHSPTRSWVNVQPPSESPPLARVLRLEDASALSSASTVGVVRLSPASASPATVVPNPHEEETTSTPPSSTFQGP